MLCAGLAVVLLVLPAAQGSAAEPVAEPGPENWPAVRDQTFALVWETVNESYFDPTFGGVDWPAVREKYQAGLPAVADKAALRTLLGSMLAELRRTHFSILPREMAVFTPKERSRIGTAGVEVAYVEGAVAVAAVKPAQAGDRAGLRPGDLILAIDQWKLEPLAAYLQKSEISPTRGGFYLTELAASRLQAAVGSKVTLQVRGMDGTERTADLVIEPFDGDWSEPMGDFPSVPVECTARPGPDGLAYLHFNVFARQVMKDVRALLRTIPPDGGLVLDLRGNGGGVTVMASGISGWLSDRVFSLGTMHLRQGHIGFTVTPQERAFLGPVAVLIDNRSASTSEIMAAGLQEAGRARIFGETSPGAALPSNFKSLPTGDLLQYAIADLQTPGGVLIEGRGVVPDEKVARTRADLAAGRDPVLAAAQRWLDHERHKVAGPAPAGDRP